MAAPGPLAECPLRGEQAWKAADRLEAHLPNGYASITSAVLERSGREESN
ncbi:hypothetical protein [Sphingomonas sp. Ag1]|jgi:hypothetical protein|nr:hypothetical protein [Sphingomonas sp. Ag1]